MSFLSHISSCIFWRSSRVIGRQPIFFLQCFRENYRKRTKCISSLPYLFLFIVFYIDERVRMCVHLVYMRLRDSFFFRSSYINMALISSSFFSLSLTVVVFDHRIVDTYIDSSFLSLSYFRACVVKAITIIPD
jgi:hypothetical protein